MPRTILSLFSTLKKSVNRFVVLSCVLLGGTVVSLAAAHASSTPWVETDFTRLRLVSGQETLGKQGQVMLGLEIELGKGWKTYWRSPGDAGFPVSLNLDATENLETWEFFWPVPHRFTLFGLQTFGYSKKVVFPFRVKAKAPTKDLRIRGTVSYLACKEICIPFDADVDMRLPAGEAFPSLEEGIVNTFVRQVPGLGAEDGLDITVVELQGADEALELSIRAATQTELFQSPDVIVEGPPGFFFSKPEVELLNKGAGAIFTIAVSKSRENKGVLEGKQITLSLIDGSRGLEVGKIARYGSGQLAKNTTAVELISILAIALVGGFILNLMPCVLPVLSLKLMSVVRHGGKDGSEIRGSFLAISLGIVTSFWLLAGVAAGFKSAGFSVGWGIQFQQPIFLIVMAGIVSLFAANLFGWFEVVAPSAVTNQAVGVSERKGRSGDFLKGMFATLLATPCSAPFLGTAVGFALARGTGEIFAIFTFLGLGMSIPYLLVAAKPGFARFLPKPGAWMVWMKVILGLLLLGTTIWLLSVLFVQIGMFATLLVAALVSLGLLILAFKKVPIFWRASLVALLALFSLVVPDQFSETPQASTRPDMWVPFYQEQIATHVANNKIVFVDVTADWCITCQVNKKLVLEQEEIQSWLGKDDVVAMVADWTLPSEIIATYLKSHDRYGIPFNIVYGPGAPEGIVLSELLTIGETIKALEQASTLP